ncbi:MAG TPA: GntG family PLP-dependent aldolase [bacterium]|nr:GntG family PLP-dependent aldolase [bacterium]
MALDFRSDTVTTPTPAMYAAMQSAPLGDDVLGHDPTVERLEREAAARFGKEAGLFFPSGTMANQAAVRTHTVEGQVVLLGSASHIFNFEVGGAALHARVQTYPIPERDGYLRWDDLAPAIRHETVHSAGTGLICLENTHNILGGRVFPLTEMRRIADGARERGLPVHLDGARIFNAQVASGVDVRDYAACADTVMFCLSKGLCAPVGSMLVGPADFLERARRVRKAMGGGLRQAGILTACGLVGLHDMVDRLADDHANARTLAEGLNASGLIEPLDLATVQTNIVIAKLAESAPALPDVVARFAAHGLLCTSFPPRSIRLCTHKDVDATAVAEAIRIAGAVAEELGLRAGTPAQVA